MLATRNTLLIMQESSSCYFKVKFFGRKKFPQNRLTPKIFKNKKYLASTHDSCVKFPQSRTPKIGFLENVWKKIPQFANKG